jgi:hypothetical protein
LIHPLLHRDKVRKRERERVLFKLLLLLYSLVTTALVQEIALSHAILQRREFRGSILDGFGVFTNDPHVPVTKAIRIVGLEGDSVIACC